MRNLFKYNLIILVHALLGLGWLTAPVQGQERIWKDSVHASNIHTVLAHLEGWETSVPAIKLDEEQKIIFRFDDLDGDVKDYKFEIIHCDMNWRSSGLDKMEYLDDFSNHLVEDYQHATNTTVAYTHYWYSFPNRDITPLVSGNYIFKVYLEEPGNTILTKKFYVHEGVAEIKAEISQPGTGQHKLSGQEIDFNLFVNTGNLVNPGSNIHIFVNQNNSPLNELHGLSPTFIGMNELNYKPSGGYIFPGGNEFLDIDMKSIRYMSPEVKKIEYQPPYYHFYLHDDKLRSDDPYFSKKDLNGQFVVEKENALDHHVEADYFKVHFRVPTNDPFLDGRVYLFGGLTNWKIMDKYELMYDFDAGAYILTAMFKQGFYNYKFVFRDSYEQKILPGMLEGNHYETENDYYFRVYYDDPTRSYDRLLLLEKKNSITE